jgi:hypothetical protein
VRYRSAYGFGRTKRLRERDRRVDRLQAMLDGGQMRLKPVPQAGASDASIDATDSRGRCSEPVSMAQPSPYTPAIQGKDTPQQELFD